MESGREGPTPGPRRSPAAAQANPVATRETIKRTVARRAPWPPFPIVDAREVLIRDRDPLWQGDQVALVRAVEWANGEGFDMEITEGNGKRSRIELSWTEADLVREAITILLR